MKAIIYIASLLGCAGLLHALEFEYEYDPASGLLPQDASPDWALRHGGGEARIEDEKLKVENGAGTRHFYMLGTGNDGTARGETSAWNTETGTATVEFRVACQSDNPELEVFQLQLSDGTNEWRIRFFTDRIFPLGKTIDATVPDTYRAILNNGLLTLISEREGVIFKDRSGSVQGKSESAGNALWFGSFGFVPGADASRGTVKWDLEFIRWTNKEASFDTPATGH